MTNSDLYDYWGDSEDDKNSEDLLNYSHYN